MIQKDSTININGALVAFHPVPGLQTTYLSLAVRAGSWYENGSSWGEMHLLEHLLLHGTEKFPSKTTLDDFMEDNGIQCNCFTGGAKIEVVMRFPSSSINSALILLSQMVFYPLLRQSDIEKEARVIHREYTDKWSKVDVRFSRKTREQLFGPDCIYIRDGIGEPKYIDGVTEDKLKATHSRFFVSSNMYLGIAGGIDVNDVSHKLNNFFVNDPGTSSEFPTTLIQSGGQIFKTGEENIKSTSIVVTWLTKGIHDYTIPERILMSFGSYLIGGSRRSALNKKIRDELGLTYGISANTYLLPTSGWFQVNTSTKPESADEVIKQIRKTVSGFLSQDIDEISLQRAKRYIKWQRLLQFDSGSNAASYLSDSLYWDGKLISQEEFETAVDNITPAVLKNFFLAITASDPFVTILEPIN